MSRPRTSVRDLASVPKALDRIFFEFRTGRRSLGHGAVTVLVKDGQEMKDPSHEEMYAICAQYDGQRLSEECFKRAVGRNETLQVKHRYVPSVLRLF